jgi:hypothetical protein
VDATPIPERAAAPRPTVAAAVGAALVVSLVLLLGGAAGVAEASLPVAPAVEEPAAGVPAPTPNAGRAVRVVAPVRLDTTPTPEPAPSHATTDPTAHAASPVAGPGPPRGPPLG